MKSELEGIGD